MGKIIEYPSGEKTEKKKVDIEGLLSIPLQLFCYLYKYINKDFKRISNNFLTKPEMRKQHDELSVCFFKCFYKMYPAGTPAADDAKKEILKRLDSLSNTDMLIFALFIGLSKFIEEKMIGEVKAMGAFKTGPLTITPRPANPIYECLVGKIRKPEDVGINIIEFTGLFQKITILEELTPQIRLQKPDRDLMETNDYLRKRIPMGFKIAVSPFFTELEFETGSLLSDWPKDQRTPFWFKKVINFDSAEKILFSLLERCLDEGINILVLPELTIDESLLDSLKKWLLENNREKVSSGKGGLIMVVAGSFHVHDKDDIRNVSTVLNHRGDVLWTQDKHQVFSVTGEDIHKKPEIKGLLKISNAGGYEKIKPADRFLAVDTPIGRICVCICLDFFHPDNLEAFRHSGINLFFVPAMSPSNRQFRDTSQTLGRNNLASSFIALTFFLPQKIDDIDEKTASFRYVPASKNTYDYAIEANRELLFFKFK
jgi:predicted amidohydrolase